MLWVLVVGAAVLWVLVEGAAVLWVLVEGAAVFCGVVCADLPPCESL